MDLDRFLYGMYPNERYLSVPAISHSWKSLSLVGDPIAKIHIPALYGGLETDLTEVELTSLDLVS